MARNNYHKNSLLSSSRNQPDSILSYKTNFKPLSKTMPGKSTEEKLSKLSMDKERAGLYAIR
jgi:hypothetical protein